MNYLPLQLARNPIVVNIDAADPVTILTRGGLRYYLELMVPQFYGANTFESLIEFEGAEKPPETVAGGQIFRGAFFEIQDHLDSLLERTAPTFGQTGITVCDGLITPYYVKTRIENNDVVIDQKTLPVKYAIKSGIAERDFAVYKNNFMTDYIGKSMKFLTWAKDGKRVQPDQPEFLYWLCNCDTLPQSLKLKCELYVIEPFETPNEIYTAASLDNVTPMTVYCLAVGPAALGVFDHAGTVASYGVWLEDQAGNKLSETRYYRIEPDYRRNVKYVLFANSLGGFDTLCLTGDSDESLKVTRTISDRYPDYSYLPQYSEQVIDAVAGSRQLTINTGWLNQEARLYLQELLLTKEAYLVTDRAFLPLLPTTETTSILNSQEEGPVGRLLTFTYANPERNFSNLPALTSVTTRATSWRPKATACLIDNNGRRTGKRGVMLLEKYYLDDGSRVVEAPFKANTPGTEGYMPPADSADCAVATTPYLSVAISRAGTFIRSTCGAGQYGGVATITIPAGEYGSDVSQADADAKAEAAWSRLNTQAYADVYGACTTGPEFYTYAVPAGYFHYRSNSPVNFYVYYDGTPYAGNIWTLPPGPNVYPINTNDLNFPVQTPGNWLFELKHPLGAGHGLVKVYVNGTLINTWELDYNSGIGRRLFATGPLAGSPLAGGASGDKVYLEFIHLYFAT